MTATMERAATRRTSRWWLPIATVLALLLVWELAVRGGVFPERYAPPPTVILGRLGSMLTEGAVWQAALDTLAGWGLSLLISVVVGTVLGTLLGRFAAASAFFRPIVEFLRPIPSIAMIPLAVLMIGSGKPTEVFLATYAGLWQMLVAAVAAVGAVDPVARQTARSFGLSRASQLRHVELPSMLPRLVTGIRIASSTVLIFCITAELLIGMPGLGAGLGAARGVGDLPRMYAYIVIIGVLGFFLSWLLKQLESRLLFWHESVRGGHR
jgi:ABC-type nitrate/sulfonate/bicarbonate transport system permease component